MSGPVSTTGLETSAKLIGLTKHTKHGHVPSPVSPHIVAPSVHPTLSFTSIALAAAVARTATAWEDAPLFYSKPVAPPGTGTRNLTTDLCGTRYSVTIYISDRARAQLELRGRDI